MSIKSIKRQTGISLIEILVSTAVGLLLLSAAASVAISSLSSNKNSLINGKAAEDLQTMMNTITRDVRRAGYNFNAELGTETDNQRFRKIWFFNETATGSGQFKCMVFRYDRYPESSNLVQPGNGTVDTGDVRGLRLNANQLETLITTTTVVPTTCPTTGWAAISSSANLKLSGTSALTFEPKQVMLMDGSFVVDSLIITLTGNAANANPITISETIQLRNRPIKQ
ncbi:hypothetical protein K4H28_08785 [Deefgea tanakiae]|uniref:Prepilin-type N-terminal cleavage/methylation domain-containing protein n=1 Tax=Deefgea tanakiae TaxID=2865840 RepID=A0ABX8Z6A7_9NEIS|nr:hypothetical protein [Deefgea tanakiae]QZA76444.1 hypothetical protein K4H28_08785 [Deefgea tanakiae]